METVSVQTLLASLSDSYELHVQLKQLLEQKRSAIMQDHIQELSVLMRKEATLLKQIEAAEATRLDIAQAYLQQCGFMPAGPMTLRTLMGVTHQAEAKEKLEDMLNKFQVIVAQLQQLNELNQKLIHQSLTFLQFQLDLFADPGEEHGTYQNPATQTKSRHVYSAFDARA